MKLYELADAYHLLARAAEDDEDPLAFDTALGQLEDEIGSKVDNIARLARSLEAEAVGFSTEADRLAKRAGSLEARVRSLKLYLKSNLEAVGLARLQAGLFTALVQKSPPACEVLDQEAVPEEFTAVVPETRRVDARAVIEEWKRGVEVPGTRVTQGTHLRLR